VVIGLLLQSSFFFCGVVHAQHPTAEAEVGEHGQVRLPQDVLVMAESLVILSEGSMSQQDAVDIATIIDAAKKDKDTKIMLLKMKAENPEAFAGTAEMGKLELTQGLVQAYQELKLLDVLFQDKERALKEMDKEGLIEKGKLSMYKKNPDLLEADTRKGLYFVFVAMAEALEFM